MGWLTLSQAAQRWLTQAEWERRVEDGEAESYVDARGHRRVWIDERDPLLSALHGLHGELHRLRAEVDRLQADLAAAAPASTAQRRLPPPPLPVEPAAEQACPRVAAVLEEIDRAWGGSDRELERQAGLPHRFLTKARRGERNGDKSQDSWDRLLAFLAAARRAA